MKIFEVPEISSESESSEEGFRMRVDPKNPVIVTIVSRTRLLPRYSFESRQIGAVENRKEIGVAVEDHRFLSNTSFSESYPF